MIFIKINRGVLDYAKDEHDLKLKHICVSQSPLRTTYYQLLWEKMFGANTLSYKRKFAAFIAEMYTSFKENYRSEGERILVRLMKEKI